MSLFLRFKNNDNKDVEVLEEEGSDLKYFEDKAGELHTEVDQINEVLTKSMFHIETTITGNSKKNYYKLLVKIKHYADRTEHEHKKNTHRQEVNI
tara:strand:+ start:242 stop:526 length:285 start_codon:yes stop_codon:yes gene_type:complete